MAGGDRVAVRMLEGGENGRDDSLLESLREHVVRVGALSARCPAIASLHECGRAEGGGIYLALEHPEAPTLAEVLQREGQLDPNRAVRLTVRVAEALESAHMLGIAHGGLMPRNIVLLSEDESVKLTEFGVDWLRTRARGADVNGAGGSPYLAPEQQASGEATPQGDVYAVGAILYEALAGRPPELQSLSRRRTSIQPLRKLRPDVSGSLEHIVTRALEADPERRYRDMTDLFNDLWSEISPFSGAPPAGLHVRGRRTGGKRTRLIAVGIVFGAIAAIALLSRLLVAGPPALVSPARQPAPLPEVAAPAPTAPAPPPIVSEPERVAPEAQPPPVATPPPAVLTPPPAVLTPPPAVATPPPAVPPPVATPPPPVVAAPRPEAVPSPPSSRPMAPRPTPPVARSVVEAPRLAPPASQQEKPVRPAPRPAETPSPPAPAAAPPTTPAPARNAGEDGGAIIDWLLKESPNARR